MIARPILIIEDEHALGTALSFLVRRMGHLPTLVASAAAGLSAFEAQDFAAVVLDIGLPDLSGLVVLERLRQIDSEIPSLVITAHATLDHAIHAQKSGATGYLTKPLDLRQFEQTLGAMLTPSLPLQEIPVAQTATLIGAAPCLRETFTAIARACIGDIPALIFGPCGTGKSLAATIIHAHSRRSSHALVVLECSQIKETSEFENEASGTLVLDEITGLSMELQARLAGWLGSTPIRHSRILATTVHDPREAVSRGLLREDLYYALATLTVPLPPLRERSGDIPALCAWFTGLRGGTSAPQLTPPVLAALQAYPWPGNVRELHHVIDYASTLSGDGPIYLSHLPTHIAESSHRDASPTPGELDLVIERWLEQPENQSLSYESLLEQIENVMLRHLMARHDHRPTRLAAALGMHRATLRQKLRRSGLQSDEA